MEETEETFLKDTEVTEVLEETQAETVTQESPETVKVTKGKKDSTPAEVTPEITQEAPEVVVEVVAPTVRPVTNSGGMSIAVSNKTK